MSVLSQVTEYVASQLEEVAVPTEIDFSVSGNQHSYNESSQPSSIASELPVHEKSPRPTRRRAPPDRYGEWVSSITDLGVFV